MRPRPLRPLQLTADENNALVDLMASGMTDPRVIFERAPFDHASLSLANATRLPAVAAASRTTPLDTFLCMTLSLRKQFQPAHRVSLRNAVRIFYRK